MLVHDGVEYEGAQSSHVPSAAPLLHRTREVALHAGPPLVLLPRSHTRQKMKRNDCVCVCSGGFRYGQTRQPPGAGYLWGAPNHMGGATSGKKEIALRSGYQ